MCVLSTIELLILELAMIEASLKQCLASDRANSVNVARPINEISEAAGRISSLFADSPVLSPTAAHRFHEYYDYSGEGVLAAGEPKSRAGT